MARRCTAPTPIRVSAPRWAGSISLGQRLIAGARYDYVEDPLSGLITRQVIPSLTLWESEWVELRAQYTWARVTGQPSTNDFALQAVWAIGPHKHETY